MSQHLTLVAISRLFTTEQRTGRTISLDVCNIVNDLDWFRVGELAGVLVIKTVDIGHEEQEVGVYHSSRYGRQGIVVAELDLRYGQCIVLIDNRNDTGI